MSDMKKLRLYVNKLKEVRENKSFLDDQIKKLNSEEKELEEKLIPELLDELGLKELKFTDMIVTKSNMYRAYVTKANSDDAFTFLKDSNNDGILKRYVQVDINANPDIIKILDDQQMPYNKQVECHYATLSKVIGELVADKKISTDEFSTLGIYVQPKISIKEI